MVVGAAQRRKVGERGRTRSRTEQPAVPPEPVDTRGRAGKRVRELVREGILLCAFSLVVSIGLATVLVAVVHWVG